MYIKDIRIGGSFHKRKGEKMQRFLLLWSEERREKKVEKLWEGDFACLLGGYTNYLKFSHYHS